MNGIMSFNGNNASLTGGFSVAEAARIQEEGNKFQSLLNQVASKNNSSVSSSQINESGRVNGDYVSSFEDTFTSEADKVSKKTGAAANSAHTTDNRTIDRTSSLYEKSLELESYFVKMMLSTMKNTIQKSGLMGNDSHASKMYEDMLYDELAVSMTKSAGFGLADQIYMELV